MKVIEIKTKTKRIGCSRCKYADPDYELCLATGIFSPIVDCDCPLVPAKVKHDVPVVDTIPPDCGSCRLLYVRFGCDSLPVLTCCLPFNCKAVDIDAGRAPACPLVLEVTHD